MDAVIHQKNKIIEVICIIVLIMDKNISIDIIDTNPFKIIYRCIVVKMALPGEAYDTSA